MTGLAQLGKSLSRHTKATAKEIKNTKRKVRTYDGCVRGGVLETVCCVDPVCVGECVCECRGAIGKVVLKTKKRIKNRRETEKI